MFTHTRTRLVVIGNGMASLKLLEELDPDRFETTVVGAEPDPAYNRVLLSSVLAGEAALDDIRFRGREWYAERGITLLTGAPATALRPARNEVVLKSGRRFSYDRLVLATGSDAVRLQVPGANLGGVLTFRDMADVAALQAAPGGAPAVVIGGGLLGIEAAYGLAKRGHPVTLVHLKSHVLDRQLDAAAGAMLVAALATRGVEVITGASTQRIDGTSHVESVRLTDGRCLPAALVVQAIGVSPATTLAATGGIDIGRGIKVDDKLETNWPGVYAIGECAEHRGRWYGLVEPAYDQARVLARYLSGRPARYEGSVVATSLKVSGIPLYSIGDIEGAGADVIVLRDDLGGTYRKLVVRDGCLAGAILYGDTADALWYRDLVLRHTSVAAFRSALPFGRSFAEAA